MLPIENEFAKQEIEKTNAQEELESKTTTTNPQEDSNQGAAPSLQCFFGDRENIVGFIKKPNMSKSFHAFPPNRFRTEEELQEKRSARPRTFSATNFQFHEDSVSESIPPVKSILPTLPPLKSVEQQKNY